MESGSLTPAQAREFLRDALAATQREVRSWLHRRHDLDDYALHSADGSIHKGDPASLIDGIAVRKLHDECKARFGESIHFVGEESLTTAAIAPGHFALQDDAIDGTQLVKALGVGYGTTGLLFQHLGDQVFRRFAAGVATEQALVTWEDRPDREVGRLYVADPLQPEDETLLNAIHEGERDLISVVAAKQRHRKDAWTLLRPDLELSVFNLGGSPMLFALLNLDLAAVVSFRTQTPWDALDVLAIEAEDFPATVVSTDGEVGRDEVMQWFDASMAGHVKETVPPHATIAHPDIVDELVGILRRRELIETCRRCDYRGLYWIAGDGTWVPSDHASAESARQCDHQEVPR